QFERIEHEWKNGKCVYCGASEGEYARGEALETHAYSFIHMTNPEEVLGMKFDVIIGNPPYQLSDGGAGPSAIPLYHQFVTQAIKLNPRYLTMIIPSRWFAGGKGLVDFRTKMLADRRLRILVDYESSKDCFEGVDIAGGICYFLWDRDNKGGCTITNIFGNTSFTDTRRLDEYPIFIRSNKAIKILRKVLAKETKFLDQVVSTQKPFGFRTYSRGASKPFPNAIKLISSQGIGYVKRDEVTKNIDAINKYKIVIGRLVPSNGELDIKPGDGYRVMTNTRVLSPGEINTETYIVLGMFDALEEAQNFDLYIKGKLARFLLRQAISSVNINREAFQFVPLLDFKERWDDRKLYKKYELTDDEIEYIETTIRGLDNGENDNT
ncbi:MAG: Eco57I restriction-modification methylase domain-containing protein, partial [Anaerolineae bacterium]|nr:Eco57I restriction-modification methylase domain-containing protein [Anaerolineae bacterium]